MSERLPLVSPLVLSALWLAAFATGHSMARPFLGVGAAAVIVLLLFGPQALAREPSDRRVRALGAGAVVGVIAVAVAHGGYAVVADLWPALAGDVARVYAGVSPNAFEIAVVTPIVVVAEEVLWRSTLLGALEQRVSAIGAASISVLIYGAAQAGAGSPAVVLAALVLGAGMVVLKRVLDDGLLGPVAAHLVFTLGVVAVFPIGR